MPKNGTELMELDQLLTQRELVLLETFKEAEKKVAENASDWNTQAKGKRTVVLEIVYDFSEDRKIRECTINPKVKLAARRPVAIEQVRLNETQQEIFEVSERQEPLPIEARATLA